MTTRVYFKRRFPFEPTLPTQYYAGQIVDLDDTLAKNLIGQYFCEVYQADKDYPQPYEILGTASTGLSMITPEGADVNVGSIDIAPKYSGTPSMRNIANGVAYAKSVQGFGGQTRARWIARLRDTVQPDEWLRIDVETATGSAESFVIDNGGLCQIDIEWPLLSGNYFPCYPSNNKNTPPVIDGNSPITAVFDGTKKIQSFWVKFPTGNGPFIEDGFLSGWAYFRGVFPENGGGNIIFGVPASNFVGNLFNYVANTTTTGLALRNDPANGLTGMSNATRQALTSTDTVAIGATSQWCFVPLAIKKITNRTSFVGLGDSTDQLGGSDSSAIVDDAYTFGTVGSCVGLAHPVMSLSSLSDSMTNWVNNPTNRVVRLSAIEGENYIVNAMGRNDYSGLTPAQIETTHNSFISLFPNIKKFSITIPAIGGAFVAGNDMEATGLTLNSPTKNRLNDLFRSSLYSYCFDVDALLRNQTNRFRNRLFRGTRTVTGTITASSNPPLLTLTGANDRFNPVNDIFLNCGNTVYNGSGIAQYSTPQITNVLSATTANLSYAPTADITNGTFVIGACPYSANPTDKIHHSTLFYLTIRYCIGLQSDANRSINLYRIPQSQL